MTDPIPPARQTSSGLWIPGGSNATPDDIRELMHREYDPMSDTAPFDAVDRSDATTPDAPPAEPEPSPAAEAEPAKAEGGEEAEPEKSKDKPKRAPRDRREPIVRPAIARWIDARTTRERRTRRQRKVEKPAEITQRQVVTVCVMAAIVSLGAFVLSFDQMAAAASRFGWDGWLVWLFPITIDAGAVAGVVMAGLTNDRTITRNGWALGGLTLAASFVFNVTGHAITGEGMLPLPEPYGWTSTAAALLVPAVLAVFIHGASTALRRWSDQQRAAKQSSGPTPVAEQTPAAPTAKTTASSPSKPAKAKTSKRGRAVSLDRAIEIGREVRPQTRAEWTAAIEARGEIPPARPTLSTALNNDPRVDWR